MVVGHSEQHFGAQPRLAVVVASHAREGQKREERAESRRAKKQRKRHYCERDSEERERGKTYGRSAIQKVRVDRHDLSREEDDVANLSTISSMKKESKRENGRNVLHLLNSTKYIHYLKHST